MSIKKSINVNIARRNFIKGLAGAGLLSSFHVEKLFAQTTAPLRLLFVPIQHGWGAGGGAIGNITGSEFNFTLPAFWEPFNAIKDQCVFIDGLRGTFWGNAHDVSYSDILTAAVPINANNSDTGLGGPFPVPVGPSIDFVLEQLYNRPALRFSARYHSWGAPYHPLSFNDRLERLAYYRTASSAYDSIFRDLPADGENINVDPAIAEIFPHLSAQTSRIIQNVNPSERNKLMAYLDAVNALENKLVGQVPVAGGTAELKRIPQQNQSLAQEMDDFFDMVRVAFTNDTHRVAVLGMGEQNNEFSWVDSDGEQHYGHSTFTGDFHHDIAHYNEKGQDAELAYIGWTRYNAQKVVSFVQELQNTIDVDGRPLIDNTIIVLTGEVGNGSHDVRHKPHVVIGGGSRISRGRWYNTPRANASDIGSRDASGTYRSIQQTTSWLGGDHSHFSHADLFTRIANLAGSSITSFGIDAMNVAPLDI